METSSTNKIGAKVYSGPHKNRQMVQLKSKEECRLGGETVQVWIIEVPSRHAEGVFKHLREEIKGIDKVDLLHCRRFAKPKFLPDHVRGPRDYGKEMYGISRAWDSTPQSVIQMPASAVWDWDKPPRPERQQTRQNTLYLLVCPTAIVSKETLESVLSGTIPFASTSNSWAYPLIVRETAVPVLAPTSPEQANQWTEEYWPIFYRKTNTFGAHPTAIQVAEDELQKPATGNVALADAMLLAQQAATETKAAGWGIGTGCCIIERTPNGTEILAVAGDARMKPLAALHGSEDVQAVAAAKADASSTAIGNKKPKSKAKKKGKNKKKDPSPGCEGNVMGHAVMRAIGMVARKRLQCANKTVSAKSAKSQAALRDAGLTLDQAAGDAFFVDLPHTDLEKKYFEKQNVTPDGYLCLKLEFFLTHEPCVMCSMALVHSRVGKVIFEHRMPETGGLTAEMSSNHPGPIGLGYGMCWRKELNWQFMCWEYIDPTERGIKSKEEREAELAAQAAKLPGASGDLASKPFSDRAKAYMNQTNTRNGQIERLSANHNSQVQGKSGSSRPGSEYNNKGGENEHPGHDTAAQPNTSTKFTSKNAFDLLMDDGNDLPSDNEDDHEHDFDSLTIMQKIKLRAHDHANVPSSFASVNV